MVFRVMILSKHIRVLNTDRSSKPCIFWYLLASIRLSFSRRSLPPDTMREAARESETKIVVFKDDHITASAKESPHELAHFQFGTSFPPPRCVATNPQIVDEHRNTLRILPEAF